MEVLFLMENPHPASIANTQPAPIPQMPSHKKSLRVSIVSLTNVKDQAYLYPICEIYLNHSTSFKVILQMTNIPDFMAFITINLLASLIHPAPDMIFGLLKYKSPLNSHHPLSSSVYMQTDE